MGRIDIRNIDDDVVKRIEKQAMAKNLSREAYVRQILTTVAETEVLKEQQDRYELLVREVVATMKEQGSIIEKNNLLMEMIWDKII